MVKEHLTLFGHFVSKTETRLRILSVGTIAELLSLRAQILCAEGYLVFTTTKPQEALEKLRCGGYKVLLLCYSVVGEWRKTLMDEFRAHCPQGRIVAITNRPVTQIPQDEDELVYGTDGPEALLEALHGRKAA